MARIPLATSELTALGVPTTEGINPVIDTAQRNLYTIVRSRSTVDPEVSELARLRNASVQTCQLCLGLRNRRALDAGLTETDVAAATGGDAAILNGSARAAVVLADSFLGYPANVADATCREINAALNEREITDLVLELVLWTNNKVSRSLGCDLPSVRYQIYDP